MVMTGERPFVPTHIRNSGDPATSALLEAMRMSHAQDPNERATAREVSNYINMQLKKLNLNP